MSPFKYALYLLSFILIGAALYVWGLWKGENQSWDFTKQIYAKGRRTVSRALKKNGAMNFEQLVVSVKGLSVHPPFSQEKMGITEPERFLRALLSLMESENTIMKEEKNQQILYRLK